MGRLCQTSSFLLSVHGGTEDGVCPRHQVQPKRVVRVYIYTGDAWIFFPLLLHRELVVHHWEKVRK